MDLQPLLGLFTLCEIATGHSAKASHIEVVNVTVVKNVR